MNETPRFTPEEIGQPGQYTYLPQEIVHAVLEELGYGDSKMLVDAFYINADGTLGVGVLQVTEGHCKDHFDEIFRGVDQVEALAQAYVLLDRFRGDLPPGVLTVFDSIKGFEFIKPVLAGATLNIAVNQEGYGEVFIGRNLASRGTVVGRRIEAERLGPHVAAVRKQQDRSKPLFPLQG